MALINPVLGGPPSLMMVCTGNICRSAMAKVVAQSLARQRGLEVFVDSSGISDEEHGHPIDSRARATLSQAGYQVGPHRARQILDYELSEFSLHLAMTSTHFNFLVSRAQQFGLSLGNGNSRIEMLEIFDPARFDRLYSHFGPEELACLPSWTQAGAQLGWWRLRDLDVIDPWYGSPAGFADTLEVMQRCLPTVLNHCA